LNARKPFAIVDDKVIPCVLSERFRNDEPQSAQRQDDRERRLIANVLRMFHVVSIGNASAGPWPEWTHRTRLR